MAGPHITKDDRARAMTRLVALLPAGSIVYHVTRSVSRSGASRRVDFYAFQAARLPSCCRVARNMGKHAIKCPICYATREQWDAIEDSRDATKLYLTGYMACALGLSRYPEDGIKTFSADDPIYHLSYKLFGVQAGMQLRAERI